MLKAFKSPSTAELLAKSTFLRSWQEDDADFLMRMAGNANLRQHMDSTLSVFNDIQSTTIWLRDNNESNARSPVVNLAIHQDGQAIGGIHMALSDDPVSEAIHRGRLCFWLDEPHWNKGIMQKALPEYMTYFKQAYPRVVRIDALVVLENYHAPSILVRCGFQLEATHKRYWRKEQQDWDVKRFVWVKDLSQGNATLMLRPCHGLGWQQCRPNRYGLKESLLKLQFKGDVIDRALEALHGRVMLDLPVPQQGIAVMTELFAALHAPLSLEPADKLLSAPARLLFVYGTLRSDLSMSGDAWGATYNCQFQHARVSGYRLLQDPAHGYPFAMPTGDAADCVAGHVLKWRSEKEFVEGMQVCNMIEGYDYSNPESGLYHRAVVDVLLESNVHQQAYLYFQVPSPLDLAYALRFDARCQNSWKQGLDETYAADVQVHRA